MEKQELTQKIKKFMYDYRFMSDSSEEMCTKVISSSYLNSLLSKAYSDNSKLHPYSIISGDFNKLSDLNMKYGFKEGDKCIRQAIYLISSVLPKNSLICRYGGDEFIFILPQITQDALITKYIEDINLILSKNKKQLHNLSISLAYGTSSEAKSLNEIYTLVDKRVNKQKLLSDCDDNFYKTFSTLYNTLRLSPGFKFTTKQIRELISLEIQATCELLKEYKEKGHFEDKEPKMYKNLALLYKDTNQICSSDLSIEDAIKLNELFTKNDEISADMLQDFKTENLECIARDLVYSYMTNAFSKDYYEFFLQEALPDDRKYRAVLLTLSGLKLSNLLIGHNATDKYLYEVNYKNVLENIDTSLPLCKELFSPDGNCYKIAMGGGDILYIEPADSKYRPKDEFYRKNDEEPLLKYVKVSTTNPIEKSQIMDFVSYAGVKSKLKKDEFKKEIFKSEYAIELAKVCLRASLQRYCENHPNDYLDIDNVKRFIEEECIEMLRFKKVLRTQPKRTNFMPNDIHFDYCYNDTNEKTIYEYDER